MKCFKCLKDAVVPYPNGDLCGDCFLDILVKRVKKEVRAETPIKKGEKILVYGKLARYFLEKVIEGLPVVITESDEPFTLEVFSKDLSKFDKVIIPWSADDEAALFFNEAVTAQPKFNLVGHDKRVIKIFKPVLNAELKQAATLLEMDYTILSKNEIIELIQRKYPSAKFGLVKSATEFKKALE